MATSGSVDSGGYQGRVLRFEWGTNSINASTNVRNIWYKVTAVGGSSTYYYHHDDRVDINGTRIYTGSSSHSVNRDTVLAQGNMDINQNNTSVLTVDMHGGIYQYSDNINKTQSWNLDAIPRYPTANQSLNSKTLTSIKMNWSSDSVIDYLWYSTNGGSSWVGVDVPDGISGTYTISNLSINTTYTIKTRLRRKDSQLTRDTGNLSVATYDIARISSAPNIDHGDSLLVKYTNPSSSALEISLYKTDGTTALASYRSCSGSQYTFNFTDAELDTIYKQYGTGNSFKARVYIKTAGNYLAYSEITITLKGNQKTSKININGTWKRAKANINVNGTWRKGVMWENVNGTWRRCI